MNAVEIEEAISALAEQRFDAADLPFAFLAAFGNKDTTIKHLRPRDENYSDCGGILQRNNAHIAAASDNEVGKTLAALKTSSSTAKHKVQFIIATDGASLEAEYLESGETVACKYVDFPNHFGFFLPLGAFRRSAKCAIIPSTSARRADSIASISKFSRRTRIGARRSGDTT